MRLRKHIRAISRLLTWCVCITSAALAALSLGCAIFSFSGGAGFMHIGAENVFAFGVVVWNRSIYFEWNAFDRDPDFEVSQSKEGWIYEYSFAKVHYWNPPHTLYRPWWEPWWCYDSRLLGYSIAGPVTGCTRQDCAVDVYLKAWLTALIFATTPLIGAYRLVARRRASRAGLCPQCGYDLRATPARCPECGTRIVANHSIPAAQSAT